MQALPQLLWLRCLKSIIDFSPLMVAPETFVSEAIAFMAKWGKSALVVANGQVLGWLREQDVVRLVASEINFQTVKISEVMHRSEVILKITEVTDIYSIFSRLREPSLTLLPVVDEQGELLGTVTPESICQMLQQQAAASQSAVVNADNGLCTQPRAEDILGCQTALTELSASQELFRLMADTAPIFIWMSGTDSIYSYFNKTWLDFTGRTLEQELDYGWSAGVHPEDLQQCLAIYFSAVNSRQRFSMEYRLRGADGEYIWLLDTGVPRFTTDGNFAGYIGSCVDITTRVQADAALRESERRFRAIFNGTFQLTGLLTLEGIVLEINQTALDFLGLATQDVIGQPIWQASCWILPQSPDELQQAIAIAARGEFVRYEVDVLGAEHTERTIDFSIKPLKDETGKIILLIAEGRDISELKQAQAAWQKANAELERRVAERTEAIKEINRQLVFEIADRQLAEEQLHQSQQMLQLIMDNIPQSIFWKDRNSVYLGCNRNFARDAGLENPEEIVGKTDYDLAWTEPESDFYRECDARVIQTHTPQYHIVKTQQQANGKQIWLDTNKIPLYDAKGQVVGVLGTYEDITERKQAQEALEKSEERFRFLAESIPQQVWISRPDGYIEYANQRTLDYFVCSLAQFQGWVWQQWVHPEDLSSFQERWETSLSTGTPLEIEYRWLRRTDNTYRWHLGRALPLRDHQGNIINWFGTNTDIHDRVMAEEALRESEQWYQTLAAISPVGIFHTDAAGNCLYVNGHWCEIAGMTPEEAAGTGWLSAIHPEDRERIDQEWYAAAAQKVPFRCEYRFLRPDGSISWVFGQAVAELGDAGEIVAYVGTITDISERKRAEDALKHSKEKFRNLVEASSDWVWEVDENGAYTYASPKVRDILGYEPQEILGKTPFELMPPQEAQRVMNIFASIVATQQPFKCLENINRHRDGHQVILETSGIPFFDAEGRFRGYRGMDRDVTVRKQAELTLGDTQERLQAILDNSPAVIYVIDPQNRHLLVNHQYEQLFGISQAEIVGKSLYDIWTGDIADGFVANNSRIFTSGMPLETEEVVAQEDGLHTYISVKFPLKDVNGEIYALCGISTDITDRKRAEEELRHSEEQFRLLVEGVKDYAMYLLDPEGMVMSWNSGAQLITGYKAAEIIGQSLSRFFSPEDIADGIPNQHLAIANINGRCESERFLVRKDGSQFWANCILTALRDDTGKLRGFAKITRDITERKLVEESLLRLRKAIDSTSDAVSLVDISGQVIYVNPSFKEVFDYTCEQLNAAGGSAVIFRTPEVLTTVLATIQTGESWRGEVMMRTRNSGNLQIELRSDAIKDATGKIMSFVSIYTDITQRKLIEEGLRLRDRAIAASSNGIIIADATISDGPIIYVNPAFERMTGYSAVEVIGQNFRLLPGVDMNQLDLQQLRAAMEPGKGCTLVFESYRKDGSRFWHELNISPVYDANNELTHYIGIQTDITERQQAETALLVSQQRLQYLLTSSPAVIYSCQTSGYFHFTFVSTNVNDILGYEAEQFLKNPGFWWSIIHPEDQPQVLSQLSNASELGEYQMEYRCLHLDNNYRWIYDKGKLVRDEAGNPIEYVGYVSDITERKQLEQELRIALDKEKELNELKSRFISMTSHEFRTPLSTILSSSELLEHYRHKWSEEKQVTHLHRIQSAVKRMTEMLSDVLLIGKAEAGKLEYQPRNFELITYCRNLLAELEMDISHQHQINFTSNLSSMDCCMDEKLLGHILSNLLSNAIKYSPADRPINFTLTCQNEQAVFVIEDQGIGIPPEDIPLLCESFHRASNVGNIIGTGLGLAIVKKCLEAHQGTVEISSILDQCTVFTVKLPLNNKIQSE